MNDRPKQDRHSSDAQPASPDRRKMLLGLGLAGGAVASGLTPGAAFGASTAGEASQPDQALEARQPFYGAHQSGVTTARPPAGLVVSFDVLAATRGDLERLLRKLTERIEFLTQGGPAPEIDPKFPALDSGLLGPVVTPGNLTMTVALGASLFDGRFGLAGAKPTHLQRMPQFPNDALEAESCHGDLLIQICSDTPDTNIHALRDVIKNSPDLLALRWKVDGYNAPARGANQPPFTPRNLLGFKDGTANPDPDDNSAMNRLVWVAPESAEPAWAAGGSYQVVRIIRNFVEQWDRTPLQEQQSIIGREKKTGAPLTMAAEQDIPDYAGDPKGERIRLDAHIRLANPRTAESQANLILRRPYNYSRGVTKAGQLDMGLLFICFQADLENGFLAVQKRLNGEPLEEYIKPVGGGFFFALPGVPAKGLYLGQSLIEATELPGDSAHPTPRKSS
ncbi:iron uptake transporter deferrochelatase/peroxidase subunit [Methylocapsa sp. S129]|uniref:iron uptake transporter deferrochelatase/peroxidase subunit n=1 Tax=Methylocapsa sp. S129 TaxID=1641869 RepID=UPI00131CF9A8|nr:iron uptake transporter deferrochelatase/peroxidase subunit [Methylocapsa sp. S129]